MGEIAGADESLYGGLTELRKMYKPSPPPSFQSFTVLCVHRPDPASYLLLLVLQSHFSSFVSLCTRTRLVRSLLKPVLMLPRLFGTVSLSKLGHQTLYSHLSNRL